MKIGEGRLKRTAVSPVIAIVILVAVAITVSVAVSYLISGIWSEYTLFEKADIVSVTYNSNNTITVKIQNIGTTLMNITGVMVGDDAKPFNSTHAINAIDRGKEVTLIICDVEWESGQKYPITIVTSTENRYIKPTIAP